MALPVHLSCFLALLVAGLAQDIMDSRRGQVSAHNLFPIPFLLQSPCLGLTPSETPCSHFSGGETEAGEVIDVPKLTQGDSAGLSADPPVQSLPGGKPKCSPSNDSPPKPLPHQTWFLPGPQSPATEVERGLHFVPDPVQPKLLEPSRYYGLFTSLVQTPSSHLADEDIKAQGREWAWLRPLSRASRMHRWDKAILYCEPGGRWQLWGVCPVPENPLHP